MAVRSSKVRKQEGEEMGWCKETQQFVPVSVLRPTTRIESLYVRMPMTWLRDIRELPSAAMLVSGVLWHLAGVRRLATVSLGNSLLRELKVNRFAKYRGLRALQAAGLVTVNQSVAGRKTSVTIHHPEAGK